MADSSQVKYNRDSVKFTQKDLLGAIKLDARLPENTINEQLISCASASEVMALSRRAVLGDWSVCQHLKSQQDDEGCRCGFRGNIWAGEEIYLMEMGAPDCEGVDMLPLPSRAEQIATAQYICALHNWFQKNIATRQALSKGGSNE